jgi:membrane protein YdbS with pleckstrin-like domain
MSDQILISKDGVQQGYPLSDIQRLIAEGKISGNDWAWKEGLTDWVPLNQLIGSQPPIAPPPAPMYSPQNSTGVVVEPNHEEMIWEGNPSQYLNAEAYGAWSFIFLGVVVMGIFLPTAFLSLILLVPICALHCAILFWKLKSIQYTISTQRIRIKSGLLSKKIQEIELFRVRDTSADQSFTDRILKIGNLRITSGDANNPELFIQAIPNPMGTREKLRQQVLILRQKFGVRELDMM